MTDNNSTSPLQDYIDNLDPHTPGQLRDVTEDNPTSSLAQLIEQTREFIGTHSATLTSDEIRTRSFPAYMFAQHEQIIAAALGDPGKLAGHLIDNPDTPHTFKAIITTHCEIGTDNHATRYNVNSVMTLPQWHQVSLHDFVQDISSSTMNASLAAINATIDNEYAVCWHDVPPRAIITPLFYTVEQALLHDNDRVSMAAMFFSDKEDAINAAVDNTRNPADKASFAAGQGIITPLSVAPTGFIIDDMDSALMNYIIDREINS